MSKFSRKYMLPLGSLLLPLLLLTILWMILQLAPFGDNNLLVSDLGTQYLPFLNGFKRFFEEGTYSFYSFSDALGGNILSLSAYYLLSPFNFLVLFFPYDTLPMVILFIITLKISLMGFTMFMYLKKTYQQTSCYTLLFSTSYSFCGFVTVYCLNFMWLDALLFLPLIVLGIQYLWDKQSYLLYSITLFLAILTNYYMGYMICLFAVCYSGYWYFLTATPENRTFKQFFVNSKRFFITSFLTGLSTSFLLLPAVEGMLATNKTNIDLFSFIPYPKFGLSFFSQLGVGSINFAFRLDHLPIIFSGILVSLLSITYFTLPSIETRRKKYAAFLLVALFLSFWIELVNTVWHMFQSPAGFPYRNTFIFSFLLIKFAYEAFIHLPKKDEIPLNIPIAFSAIVLIGYSSLLLSWKREWLLSGWYILLTLLFIWLNVGFFALSRRSPGKLSFIFSSLLFLCVCVELSLNFFISLKDIPMGSQSQYAKTFTTQEKIIQSLEKEQTDLFRIKQIIPTEITGFKEQNNGYNHPMLYGYAGVSSYSSTLDAATQNSLKNLGLYAKNDRRIAYVDNSQVVNFLLDVAYQLTPEKVEREKNLSTDDSTFLYKNTEAIGLGFLTPQTFGTVELVPNSPLTNQETILQSLRPIDGSYFAETKDTVLEQTTESLYTLTTQTTEDGNLYFYIPKFRWETVTSFSVNEKPIQTPVYIAKNQLYNLGFFEKNTPIVLQMETEKDLSTKPVELKTLSEESFTHLIDAQKTQAIQLKNRSASTLEGTIDVTTSDRKLLYLSIPYDKNWKIMVDDEPVLPKKILGNFIGIELTEGTYQLTMTYQPKSFILGSVISLFTILGWLSYQGYKLLQKKRSPLST